jgi:hypothetical protein
LQVSVYVFDVRKWYFDSGSRDGVVMPNEFKALPMNRSTIALAVALSASPALAGQDYPPGLFENSPVVPSGPPDATAPSQPPDAADPFGPRDAVDPLDDYCAGVPFRTYRSLAEVRRAHAQCDHAHSVAPLWPPAEGPDE